ncbi:MAG: hypothetical protein IJZ31_03525 [Bacteroidaceae bacterium]|nr:hypothetical protein [Bacteroidaceae bacterium]
MKTFILSAMLCLATLGAFGQSNGDSETPVPVGITVHEQEIIASTDTQERSLQYWEVSAYVHPISGEVEVNLYNIGDATISIVNADGEVVDSAEVNTSIPSVVPLQVDGSSNIYYIVVTSPTIYAEGSFEI